MVVCSPNCPLEHGYDGRFKILTRSSQQLLWSLLESLHDRGLLAYCAIKALGLLYVHCFGWTPVLVGEQRHHLCAGKWVGLRPPLFAAQTNVWHTAADSLPESAASGG